jgi:hypothetical protein
MGNCSRLGQSVGIALFGEKEMAVERTISIEGRNEFGGICRKEVRIDRSAPEREGGLSAA